MPSEPTPKYHQKVYPNFSLKDKVYIVTGGGRGLGLVMAEAMTEAGAEVHCFDRLKEPDPEFAVSQEIANRDHIGSLHYHHVDVRDSKHLDDSVSKVTAHSGRIDGLVAAAGIQQLKDAVDFTPEEVTRMFDINYTGLFMTVQAVARHMLDFGTHGSIVLIASMSGFVANKGMHSATYNSSKAAVIQLGRNLAMEWGPKGIRVNSLCPGHVITPMVEKNFEEVPDLKTVWTKESMLGRLAQPEEFTGAVIFMLSDASSYMTGSSLLIDGGHTAW
ncbi:3-alpha-(or 20-beta)-hydroxysteroid dehydrogenase [Arthroderma uncinatum]|uniref:3-alpha-(or 20-beta)-hydroxysteroid dehydrogenase n=1 Tax=Arthroderma uncinatum TaxID=74035 RepID=UPI00144AE42A|nr:3-alpha-(or 20-beta)-hydroxysteroid dehydrogenase [Arthroderma uncinatum]KAF3479481.1 3-alpha-(or 20-beta)-hydroxysteroid dehydrogenase [Arthroderma uncinatum]